LVGWVWGVLLGAPWVGRLLPLHPRPRPTNPANPHPTNLHSQPAQVTVPSEPAAANPTQQMQHKHKQKTKPTPHSQKLTNTHTPTKHFHHQQFQALFTLFPKFFSSFPHGTCSLSVSRPYLALDGVYHPLRAALPNNSTRPSRAGRGGFRATNGTLTLRGTPFQGISARPARWQRGFTPHAGRAPARPVSELDLPRFTRRYWGDPCWFLLLR